MNPHINIHSPAACPASRQTDPPFPHLRGVLLLLPVLLQEVVSARPQDDFVIHVRHVHDVMYVVPEVVLQHSPDDIKGHVVAGMAHVGRVIDRGPAGIPADLLAASTCCGDEGDLLVHQAVVQLQQGHIVCLWRVPPLAAVAVGHRAQIAATAVQ